VATVAHRISSEARPADLLSGTPRADLVDRWVFVGMAVWFIVVVLTGFIPDSVTKVGMVEAGKRPPFPLALHVHAVLMGSFLLLLLAQTWLMATGRKTLHMQLGIAGVALAAALVLAGAVLAPTMYFQTWDALQSAPAAAQDALRQRLSMQENILLLQLRIGILFPFFLAMAIKARTGDPGLHKRMVILATAIPIEAAIARMNWLPTTMPGSPLSILAFSPLIVVPMVAWDVIRNRRVHRAYYWWVSLYAVTAVLVELAWNTSLWHATARRIMGV
jgi:hypothetical protein